MVELDKILSERSDERILKAVREVSDVDFNKLVDKVLGYLELKVVKSRPKETFHIADCIHRPSSKKYVVFFSRRDAEISKQDIESLASYMGRAEVDNGLVLTTSSVSVEAAELAEDNSIGIADGAKLAALLRRFDLDKEIVRFADVRKEKAKKEAVPGADKNLERVMAEGYEAMADKEYVKALDAFDRAILVDETWDIPWRMKGNTLDEMGYHEQALECYRNALELHPESDETWFSLGNCFFALSRYNEEIMCYDRALMYNPTMQKALVNKGSTLHRQGRYKEALETYDKVLKLNYRLEKVHNNRGATLHALRRTEDALESYNRAIELKHDYIEAWMNKGNLLYEMARYPEALEAFSQMIQIRPELPKGWYLKGLAERKLSKITQAKASFEQALRLDPEFHEARRALEDESKKITEKFVEVPRIVQDIFPSEPAKAEPVAQAETTSLGEDLVAREREETIEEIAEEVYGDRAELLLLLGKLEEALDVLGKSLKLDSESAPLLTAAGNVLYSQGKRESAIKTYEHALAADPGYEPAMFNLHNALVDVGDFEQASKVGATLRSSAHGWQAKAVASLEALRRKDYKQALDDIEISLSIENLPLLVNYKGLVKLLAGDLAGAGEAFERTSAMSLDQSEAHNNLGVAFLQKGDPERASLEFDKAIRALKNNPAAWNNRGCVLYAVDRTREAIACFEESLVMLPSAIAMTNKGFSQLAIDALPEALQSFEQSLKLAETPEAYNNKGLVLQRMGKPKEAQVAFREALRLAPQFKDAAINAGIQPSQKAEGKTKQARKQEPAPSRQPEIVGDKESTLAMLASVTEVVLRSKRRAELEALCSSLSLNTKGTKAELIASIMRAKEKLVKR